ncbi:MAG: OmpA family protein [Flavobacteriaceae bacterium]|nr:OmpA family protein [Flavobacteriaceae bacterium]
MKKILLSSLTLIFGVIAFAQDLPTNAEPGKCYVRCTTPDVWKNETVTVETAASYKVLKAHGPQYSTEDFTVEIKPTSSRLEVIPAQYETKDETFVVQEASTKLELIPGKSVASTEEMIIQEATTRLEIVPAQYETKNVEVIVQPASTRLEIIPAQYETRDVVVVVKPASSRLEIVPAEWTTETVSYVKGTNAGSLQVIPAELKDDSQTIITKNASARWVMGDKAPDCESSDPNACRVWCYRNVPEQSINIPVRELVKDASIQSVPCAGKGSDCTETGTYTKKVLVKPATTRKISIPEVTKTMKTTVMVKPATTRTITIPAITNTVKTTVMVKPPTTRTITIPAVTKTIKKTTITPTTTRSITIPAVTKTIKKTVMVKPPTTKSIPVSGETKTLKRKIIAKAAWTDETTVPSKTKTVTKEVLVSKGGLTTWKEVDCKLVNNNPLPINWNLGSATLTNEAKRIIDSKLIPVLADGVNIALSSHTDSRGSDSSNQALSERRAQAVVNYLINKKNINPSRLTANGYGETRLTNRCSNSVSCTEAEHRVNRRTTFRVVNSN